MKYNFDESETKKLKERIAKNNKMIEDAVISQQYKKAYKLKELQVELEKKIVELKQKFQVPKEKRMTIDSNDVQKILSIATGIPISNLSKNETQKLKDLSKNIKNEIIGQDDAVT